MTSLTRIWTQTPVSKLRPGAPQRRRRAGMLHTDTICPGSAGLRGVDFRASLHCGVGDPRFHLVYFPTRGLAEVARLVLAEAAVPYTYECIGADLWTPQLKAQFTFGKLPVCSPTSMGGAVSFATRR